MVNGRSVEAISRGLESVRARARSLLVARGVMTLAAWAVAIVLVVGAADFVLRTPAWLRMGLWVAGLVGLAAAAARLVAPAIRFRPTLTEVALRIERSEAGRSAGLPGVLASGVELGAAVQRGDLECAASRMAEPVVVEAAARFGLVRPAALLSGAPARRAGLALALVAAVAALLGVSQPRLMATGVLRVLAPWAGAEWPKRTEVANATRETVHPIGVALPLRAAVLRGAAPDDEKGATRVWASFRVLPPEGRPGPVTRLMLTHQRKTVTVARAGGAGTAEGVLFERLVEPGAVGISRRSPAETARAGAHPAEADLEFWFETDDDRTPAATIRLVEPPAVVGALAQVADPPYARAPSPGAATAAPGDARPPRSLDLGAGIDERAVPPPMLAGTRVDLRVALNKPVPGPEGPEAERAAWLRRSVGEAMAEAIERGEVRATFEPELWRFSWDLAQTIRLPIRPTDRWGVAAGDEAVYRFEAIQDQPPSAAVTAPESDESVLATAVIDASGEGRDDVGLAAVWLEKRTARRPAGSAGAPAEPADEWLEIGRSAPAPGVGAGEKRVTVQASLDLSAMPLRPGDEVWLSALAADAFELAGRVHPPTRSPVRRLTIISDEAMLAEVWGDLAAVRQDAIRLDEEQARTAQRAADPAATEAAQRAQASITERLARQRQAVGRVEARLERNRLNDRDMADLVEQAGAMLDDAGRRSVQAAAALDRLARDREAGREGDPAHRAEAAEAQSQVRDALESLADLLDRGQDAWSIRRSLERAMEEQRALRERTERAGRSTTGKAPAELTPGERQDLDQIGREQRALAERTAEAIDRMLRDRDSLRQRDPSVARAVEDAARRGQRERVSERMNEAARQAEQNQANSATADQERAERSLQQMLDDINAAAGNRDQELRRLLASLIDQINALIHDQEGQIEALEKAAALPAFTGLDAGMLRLRRNTLAVQEEAGRGPRDLAPVASLLGQAADAQGEAVAGLRAVAVDEAAVRAAEDRSLQHLTQARQAAERLDRQAAQREADRKAAELRRAYREALTEQVAIKGETDPLVGAEPSRRTQITARALGERQRTLRERLAALRASTRELEEAVVFDYAHTRLDSAMGEAAGILEGGEATATVGRRQQSAVRLLQGLVEALDRSRRNPDDSDDFRENPGGAGSGGQAAQRALVPPAAQVKLLRALQVEAAALTAEADDSRDAAVIDEAGRLQADLAARAEALLRSLMERQRPSANPAPGGDGGEGGAPE
jgi:hypothetical protein